VELVLLELKRLVQHIELVLVMVDIMVDHKGQELQENSMDLQVEFIFVISGKTKRRLPMIIQITLEKNNIVKEYSYAPNNFQYSSYNGELVEETFDGDIIIYQKWFEQGGWKIIRTASSGITTSTVLKDKRFNEETGQFINWNES
jgi:hypothetical protein